MYTSRRRYLLGAGALAVTGTAGCLGSGGGEQPTADGPLDNGSLANHAALAHVGGQPQLGPPAGEATGLVVAFEDPSCPSCARWERDTVPQIRSELVEPGDATFVFRGYPVVYPWGRPASHALEATFARSADAHWTLAAHYFENQRSFRGENQSGVLEQTRSFLASNTEVNAQGVVEAVEEGGVDQAVQRDLDAGDTAGVSGTPHVFLFRDGEYVTDGPRLGFETIEASLQL